MKKIFVALLLSLITILPIKAKVIKVYGKLVKSMLQKYNSSLNAKH